MAKKRDEGLLRFLRENGVRKRVARTVSRVTGGSRSSKQTNMINRTIHGLRSAAGHLESRVGSSRRSEAARTGARTRKRNAARRGGAGRRGARSRS
jgi:hypothetical protein